MNSVFPLAIAVVDVRELVDVKLALTNMSRAELAAAVGCSRTKLWAALRGEDEVDPDLACKLVEVLTSA